MNRSALATVFAIASLATAWATGCHGAPEGAAPDPAVTGEGVWLTIGGDAVDTVREAFADRDPGFEVTVSKQGLGVVRLDRGLLVELSALMHHEFRRCGGFVMHASQERASKRADARFGALVQRAKVAYAIDNPEVAARLRDGVDDAHILETMAVLSGFTNRYHANASSREAGHWLADLWESYAVGRPDITVELVSHPTTPMRSVMMTITGASAPEEVVVMGGHLDSIAGSSPGPSTTAPGADDDASGVATISEVLRVALASGYRPARTVVAIAYAAEEVGLRGSEHIADQFAAAGVDVVGVLQFDMTNYNGSGTDIFLIDDFTNAAQNAFVGDLIDAYLPFSWSTTTCGYACSDHASWTAAGFPASFPFESSFGAHNPFIHTAGDSIAGSGGDARHAAKFAKIGGVYLAELAKGAVDPATGSDDPPIDPPRP